MNKSTVTLSLSKCDVKERQSSIGSD